MTSIQFLDGIKVLDFSHMLAGPLAARRLGELGARVIKIEGPRGEVLRTLGDPRDWVDGDHLYFHAYNAGKDSISLDLKSEEDRTVAANLAREADVVIQSFRPGVLDRLGLGYEQIRQHNPKVIYASVSGFGAEGSWRDDPGQDLIAQARSGLMWLSGPETGEPAPIGILTCDITTANLLTQAILAALLGRDRRGHGTHVEVSLLEAALEMQMDTLPLYINRNQGMPERSRSGASGAVYAEAPYGVYPTADGYIAVSSLPQSGLEEVLGAESSILSQDVTWLERRDLLIAALRGAFSKKETAHWLAKAKDWGAWIVEVLNYDQLIATDSFQALEAMTPPASTRGAAFMRTPYRFDGERPAAKAAPRLNDAGELIRREGWSAPVR